MEKRYQSLRPLLLLVIINLLGLFLVLLKNNGAGKETAVLAIIMCALSVVVYAVITYCRLGDGYLFVIISMLSSIGIIMQTRINPSSGMRQMKLYLAGVACFFVTMLIYKYLYKYLKRLTIFYYGLSMLLFMFTAIFGAVRNGSKNWIVIGGMSIQPSEFIRILFVLSLAAVLTNARPKQIAVKKEKKKGTKRSPDNPQIDSNTSLLSMRLAIAAIIAYSNALFLLLQREWGIAVLFFAIYIAFLYIYGESKLFFLGNVVMVILAATFGAKFMSHIKVRIETWIDPFADVTGKGYQLVQSLFAIGAGGFTGTGIGNGSPYFIPVVSSDFIFSAICEEMGVLGGVAVIMLYFVLVYRGFKIALSSTNEFNKAVSVGLSVMLGIQTFIIVGGVIKLIPLTGITLPFISMGGSSMITTFIAFGILQAVSGVKGEVTDEIE